MDHISGDIRNTSDVSMKSKQRDCYEQSTPQRPATSAERILMDLSNQASRAQDQEARSLAALEFFGKHPEFAEFIGLIRSGSISI
jgi:hypothetical protein